MCEIGEEAGNPHYHMVMKFQIRRRWRKFAQKLRSRYNVDISPANNRSYAAMLSYLTVASLSKPAVDPLPVYSENHPMCLNTTQDDKGSKALALRDIVVKHKIRTVEDFQRAAKDNRSLDKFAGSKKFDVAEIKKFLNNIWEYEELCEKPVRLSLWEILARNDYPHECDLSWLRCVKGNLARNFIDEAEFVTAYRNCIRLGRRRGVCLFLYGSAGAGKSTMLQPFFDHAMIAESSFVRPESTATYPLSGLKDLPILICLDELRWKSTISPQDLLSLADGKPLTLSLPKNHYASNVKYTVIIFQNISIGRLGNPTTDRHHK